MSAPDHDKGEDQGARPVKPEQPHASPAANVAAKSAKPGGAADGKPRPAQAEGLRQAMSWLHTWSGLIFGWVLFAMFLTGTLAFFRPEITRWMQPEVSVQAVPTAQSVAVAERFLREHAPNATRWFITPSSPREPAILLTYQIPKPPPGQRAFKRAVLDPATGQELKLRDTRGGEFFYRFHFELEMGYPWGRWLASIAGMFMLVAIISGIITHKKIFADFFTFRPGKGGQRAWMDGHNVLSVLGLPFHLLITFSGVVLFATMLLPAGILATYDNERQFFDEAFPAFAVKPATGKPAELLPLYRTDIQRLHVAARYSEAAVFNGVVYLAGMVPECEATDIRSQTADVLKQIEQRLAEAGSDKTRILRTQIYLQDITDIAAMNEVWDAWVVAGSAPPRATVQAALANPAYLIEVVVTAAVKATVEATVKG